jgi:hypothetical protein
MKAWALEYPNNSVDQLKCIDSDPALTWKLSGSDSAISKATFDDVRLSNSPSNDPSSIFTTHAIIQASQRIKKKSTQTIA